jgi:hypothetical protein
MPPRYDPAPDRAGSPDEGCLVIESPEAIQRALLAEWAEVAGERNLVEELLAERRAAAVREAEEVEAYLAEARGRPGSGGAPVLGRERPTAAASLWTDGAVASG